MTLLDAHGIAVTIGGYPVQVLTAETTLDRGWAPYAQGSATILAPGGTAGLLDPTARPAVTVRLRRRYSGSKTIGEVSALHAGKTFAQASAQHAGKTFEQMSAQYRNAWNGPTGPVGYGPGLTVAG